MGRDLWDKWTHILFQFSYRLKDFSCKYWMERKNVTLCLNSKMARHLSLSQRDLYETNLPFGIRIYNKVLKKG